MKRLLIATLLVLVAGLFASCTTVPRETPNSSATTTASTHTYSK